MVSKVSIISDAFILLGKDPLESVEELNNGSKINTAASLIYDNFYPTELTGGQWHFARKVRNLSKLNVKSPIDIFDDVFQIPGDKLSLIRTFPQSLFWEILEDKFLTNALTVAIDYVFKVPESAFPPYFTTLFTYRVAAGMAMTVTQQSSVAALMKTYVDEYLNSARAVDAQQIPSPTFTRNQVFAAHLG